MTLHRTMILGYVNPVGTRNKLSGWRKQNPRCLSVRQRWSDMAETKPVAIVGIFLFFATIYGKMAQYSRCSITVVERLLLVEWTFKSHDVNCHNLASYRLNILLRINHDFPSAYFTTPHPRNSNDTQKMTKVSVSSSVSLASSKAFLTNYCQLCSAHHCCDIRIKCFHKEIFHLCSHFWILPAADNDNKSATLRESLKDARPGQRTLLEKIWPFFLVLLRIHFFFPCGFDLNKPLIGT